MAYQLTVRVQKALDQLETALGVFLDIQEAFNNTCYDTMCVMLSSGLVVITPLRGGLGPPWRAPWLS